ncbi:MAG: hypothetical protein V1913_10095, partial [Fibrobacterota bacterium]
CQVMNAAVLIANDIPVLMETTFNKNLFGVQSFERLYAFIYHYKMITNQQNHGEAALAKDKTAIYLEYNIDVPGRFIRPTSKTNLDLLNHALSPDLLSLGERKAYNETYTSTVSRNRTGDMDMAVSTSVSAEIVIDYLYIIVPSSFNEKRLLDLFNTGLGSLDFSYKAPAIKKIF